MGSVRSTSLMSGDEPLINVTAPFRQNGTIVTSDDGAKANTACTDSLDATDSNSQCKIPIPVQIRNLHGCEPLRVEFASVE